MRYSNNEPCVVSLKKNDLFILYRENRISSIVMQIDRSNYEIWLIDWLDENLNEIQIEQLQLFLRDNPDLKEEIEELTTFREE